MIWYANRKFQLVIILVIALVMGGIGASDIIGAARFRADINQAYNEQRNDFNTMSPSEFSSDMNIYGDVLYLYGCYCEETTTHTTYGIETSSEVSGSYYIMPLYSEATDEEKYITVLVHNKDATQALDHITDDTFDYLGGNDNVQWHDYFLMGKVKPLESDARPYLVEYLEETEWFADSAEINNAIIPYQIEEYDPDRVSGTGKVMFAIGIGGAAVAAVVFIFINRSVQRKGTAENNPAPAYVNAPVYPAQSNTAQNSAPQYTPPQYTPPQDINNIKQPLSPDEFFNKPIKREAPKQEEKPAAVPEAMEGLAQPAAQLSAEAETSSSGDDLGAMDGISTDGFSYDDVGEPAYADADEAYDSMDGIESVALPDDYGYDDTEDTNN